MTEGNVGPVERVLVALHLPEELDDGEHGCQGDNTETEEQDVHVHLPERDEF